MAFTLVNVQQSKVLAIQHWTFLVTAFQNDQKSSDGPTVNKFTLNCNIKQKANLLV